jgi:hypothetical protein
MSLNAARPISFFNERLLVIMMLSVVSKRAFFVTKLLTCLLPTGSITHSTPADAHPLEEGRLTVYSHDNLALV